MFITPVLGLSFGDEAKAKVTAEICKNPQYTHCLRFNGGNNCGHTIYKDNEKIVLHSLPTGIVFNKEAVIGPGCVVNPSALLSELEQVSKINPEAPSKLKIAKNVHIITEDHIKEETSEQSIGTTRKGIGPAYKDKYARTGIRAESIPELKPFLIDFHTDFVKKFGYAVAEGAQGYFLDIIDGDYPYVTSSHCGIGGVILNGIPPSTIKNTVGVIKCYDTYVGNKVFQDPTDPELIAIQTVGQEIGATTGRKRQVDYLNFDRLLKALTINEPVHLVINKLDVLRELNSWRIRYKNELLRFNSEEEFTKFLKEKIHFWAIKPPIVHFSDTPFRINNDTKISTPWNY